MTSARMAEIQELLDLGSIGATDEAPTTRVPPGNAARLRDAAALVTGAGNGIGRHTALALAAAGASVTVADIDAQAAIGTATDIRAAGGEAVARAADIASPRQARELVEQAISLNGRLDIVVNNAGVIHVDPLLEVSPDTLRRVLSVNLEGTFAVSQAAVRHMRGQPIHPTLERRGLILNVSSLASEIPRAIHVAYGASKAAVNYVTRTFAGEFADDAIATVSLYPGNVREGMWRHLGAEIARVEQRSRTDVESERAFQPGAAIAALVRDAVATPGMQLNGRLVLHSADVIAA